MEEGLKIGTAIQKIREKKGFTSQVNFCKKVDIDQPYFSQIENNKKIPSLSYLKKIAEALEVPLFFFFWFDVISKEDVSEEKQYTFEILKPKIDEMLLDIFS